MRLSLHLVSMQPPFQAIFFDVGGQRIVVQELTYCWNLPDESIEVSSDSLRTILGQVEADLYESATYGQAIANLQTLPNEISNPMQRMIRAIGREAIRLAFRRLVKKKLPDTIAVPPPPPSNSSLALKRVDVQEPLLAAGAAIDTVPTEEVGSVETAEPLLDGMNRTSKPRKPDKPRRRLTRKEQAAQAALAAWEERLRELGREVRQLRYTKRLTLYQLHLRTQIPVYQLEAIEAGRTDRLPEDVYIRGFLRRIGYALGADGTSLSNSLPPLDPVKAILPSWYHPQQAAGVQVRPMHLYFGYAAVLAGGLAWLSHQPASIEPPAPPPAPSPAVNPSPKSGPADAVQSSVKSVKAQVTAPSVAPPETSPF